VKYEKIERKKGGGPDPVTITKKKRGRLSEQSDDLWKRGKKKSVPEKVGFPAGKRKGEKKKRQKGGPTGEFEQREGKKEDTPLLICNSQEGMGGAAGRGSPPFALFSKRRGGGKRGAVFL